MNTTIALSPYFEDQFEVIAEDQSVLEPFKDASIVSRTNVLKNSDRITELCEGLSKVSNVGFTEDAAKLFQKVRNESNIESESLTLPFDLKAFQKRGLHALDGKNNAMFICSCGTGKTCLGTVFFNREFDRGNINKVLVFCPAPLIEQWVSWLETATKLTVGTVDRNKPLSKRQAWYQTDTSDIWVINYDRANTKDWHYIIKALEGKKLCIVYDEVQRLKNRKSSRHKKFIEFNKKLDVKYKIGLTATPFERGPEDFYNEWRIIEPDIYGRVKDFEHLFTYNDGEKDMFNRYLGFQNLDIMGLMSAGKTFIAEKTNPEIAKEFPEKQEIVIELDLSPIERKLYNEIENYGKEVSAFDREQKTDTKQRTLFMLMLERICRMPEVLLNDDIWQYNGGIFFYKDQLEHIHQIVQKYAKDLVDSKNSEKLQKAEELVDQIIGGGEKLIIFAQHTNNCLIPLANHLKQYKPLLYTGEQSAKERKVIGDAFRHDKNYNLILMSDAGKEGIDLPEGRYLIHYDTPSTYSAYNQRSDRIHRISSQHNHVTIYRFVTRETIEERIEDTMAGRRALAQDMGIGEYEIAGENDTMKNIDYILGF